MKIEYKQYGGSADEASISFQYAYPDDTTLSVVPSTRLWQSYDLAFHIYDEGGLTATYYNSLPSGTNEVVGLSTADKAVQESTVDWSGTSSTDRPYPSSITSGTFSVRWIGFVQPSRSDLYTFYTPIHGGTQTSTDERVRLWIDNSLVISQWESLSSIDPSGTYQFAQPNEFYNLMMDYKVSSSTAPRSIALQWENAGAQYLLSDNSPAIPGSTVSRGVIPPNRLFRIRTSSTIERDDFKAWDLDFFQSGVSTLEDRQQETPGQWAKISACPEWSDTGDNVRYNRCRGKGLRTNEVLRVDVKPAVVCASQTTISDVGGSLSLSTAGVTRTFTLTARDAYDNQRDSTDDAFIARATLSDSSVYGSSVAPFYGSLVPQDWATLQAEGQNNPVWNQYGKYEISYLITQSASFFMTVMSADVQGNGLLGTYFSTTSLSGIIYTQVDPNIDFNWGQTNPTTDPNILVGSFSARWTGYIKMNNTETYTFTTNCDYGVSLQVGSIQVISQWGSNASYYSGVFTATSGVLYDFIFEYKTQGPISFCTLSYSSPSTPQQTVPTSQFFVEAQTVNGGEVPLDTLPTLISATASTINGTGLSLATAGVTASFTVIAKDMYGNVRDSCADILFARMYPDPPTCLQGQYPYDWATWSMGTFFTCTSIGKISLATTDTSLMTNQINTNTNAGPIGTNGSYGFYMPVPSNTGSSWSDVSSVCTSDRFTGNKHPFTYVQTRAGSSTLYVSETPGGIGSSYAAAAGRGLMATYYETPDFGNPQFAQDCITQDGTPYENAYCNVGTINISYSNMMTPGSLTNDGAFSVRWLGFIRMSTTNQNGQTWTFSTPLGQGTYNDERVKLWIDNSLLIDEWTSLSTTNPTSTVPYDYFSDKQLYDIKVEYKNVFGGPTDGSYLQLKLGDVLVPSDSLYVNHLIEGIASRITVLPNVAFHRECEVYGDGLTIATAGVQATFAIQSKDAYNNQRGVGGDLFIVRAFSDGCQTIDNTIEQKATCQPYGPAIKTCGGTNDPVCSHLTNPAPQMNDGGDGDGMNWAGALSVKDGGKFRTDVEGVCPTCPRLIRANVVDNQDSTYTAYFTGTQKGRYTVVTSLVNSGGLLATYYDGDPVQSTTVYSYSDYGISVRVDPLVDWSAAQAGNKAIASLTSSTWGVRWVGFVRPSLANQYTFQVSIGESTERVKLWVDNSIIIQQWTSIDGTTVSGTMGFGNGNGYYDISLLYKCATSSGQCAYNLKWESTPTGNANNDVSLGTIPSDRLFQRYDVPNTGLTCTGTPCITKDWSDNTTQTTLEIFPSVTCASLSVAHGNGLTLTTVGVPATFTIQAKDAYSNSREDTDASFTVDLFGSGGSVIYNGAVYNGWYGAGNYTASYTAVDANNYNLYVRYGAYNILGSPFSTTIKPGNACGAQSTIQGSGLTAATISPAKSVFTIQARDQYGNAKTQALPTDQDFIVRVVRTSGAGMQGTNGLPPFYDATAISSSPTLHATFNTPTDDGRYAGYYQVPSTPSPSGYIHYLYASWIAQGGIAATYYAGTPSSSNGYSSLALSAPINVLTNGNAVNQRLTELGGTVEDSSQAASTLWGSSALTSSTEGYVIRWSGMYQTLTSQRYFQWKVTTDNGDRVRLWIDNKLIIDQWTSLDSNTPSGGYIFDSVDGIYDVTAEYWRADGKPTTPANIEVLDGSSTAAFSSIPSTRLYFTQDLSGSPYAVTVTV
uniref:PA14 domain-containing protein n=1 Tax=Guillardia theta TaxID=55529 RepID=A0A7S4KLE9_GUITH